MFGDMLASAGPGNIIVPLSILDISGTSRGADVQFQVDLKKQYYTNAQIRFKYRSAAALGFAGVPVMTAPDACRMVSGKKSMIRIGHSSRSGK